MSQVVPGLERLLASPELVGGRRWALLSNQASVTRALEPARSALLRLAPGPAVRLFAPEHGLDGVAQDMEAVEDARDRLTGMTVRSLYGHDAATLAPRPEDLEDVDVLVVDLPDIGTRYYTFGATMDAAMGPCAAAGVEMVVLDRPNPINGAARGGGLVHPGFASFVGQIPTPIRHGLTLGELALLLQRERYPGLELTVVPCDGWSRPRWWDECGLPWIPPSPNMPSLETAAVYPGMCLVEGTTLSEGRGTTTPFLLVGAPFVDPERLAARLRGRALPGVAFRPAVFRPMFSKHAGRECGGVELHVTDRGRFRPVRTGLEVLCAVHTLHPDGFAWRREAYEFIEHIPAIDLLTGSARAREVIEGRGTVEELLAEWEAEIAGFAERVDDLLLYR